MSGGWRLGSAWCVVDYVQSGQGQPNLASRQGQPKAWVLLQLQDRERRVGTGFNNRLKKKTEEDWGLLLCV